MGCVSSKLFAKEIRQENLHRNRCYSHTDHVVSLTSTTYGLLKLDKEREQHQNEVQVEQEVKKSVKDRIIESKKPSPSREEPSEIINTWELMEGLDEEDVANNVRSKKNPSPKSRFIRDSKSPLKLLNQLAPSPMKLNKAWGKENRNGRADCGIKSLDNSPKTVLKERNTLTQSVKKPSPRLWASIRGSPANKRCESWSVDSGVVLSRGRRSLSPLFDPELVASFEKEVSEEKEEIKKMVYVSINSLKEKAFRGSDAILERYYRNCPPGGENAAILHTTTLRGIRKTFEDCNVARKVIESQNVKILERDVSMHSVYKEEIRKLMDSKQVKVPLLFVKGRLIGGADEIVKLDEEGKLGILLGGLPKATSDGCKTCGGIRFVMCVECSGSCKLLGGDGRKSVKCENCNENGLIHCPKCS